MRLKYKTPLYILVSITGRPDEDLVVCRLRQWMMDMCETVISPVNNEIGIKTDIYHLMSGSAALSIREIEHLLSEKGEYLFYQENPRATWPWGKGART